MRLHVNTWGAIMTENIETVVPFEDMDEGTFCWHHRTIRHIDSRMAALGIEDEPYETAHEFSYTGAEYDGFSFAKCVAMSKEEAVWISEAYDLPPVIEVDDADEIEDEHGFPDYTKYVLLDKKVIKGEQHD